MALPKFESPNYNVILPVTGIKVDYRPYLVKEQKNLMLALQMEDESNIFETVKKLLEVCTYNKVDISSLPSPDAEFLFLQIQSKSTSDSISVNYTCKNEVTVKPEPTEENPDPDEVFKICNTTIKTSVNLIDVEVEKKEGVSSLVKLSETVGLKLRYPTFNTFVNNVSLIKEEVDISEILYDCIVEIYDGEDLLKPGEDFTEEECKDFIESLPADRLEIISDFFKTTPKLKYSLHLKCPSCGNEETIRLKGLKDFLA